MTVYKDIELSTLPSLTKGYFKAAGQLVSQSLLTTHIGGSKWPSIPAKRFILKNYHLDPTQIQKYAENTGLASYYCVPLTYLYSVAFPIVIKLLTENDFPYVPVGLVHLFNKIKQIKSVPVSEIVDIYVHAENLREHRSGMLIDIVTEVYCHSDLVWFQISTMLHRQKTSLSGTARKNEDRDFDKTKIIQKDMIKASQKLIRQYASISGDRNPIHMSPLTAKIFGFPKMIAHGSWMMARILSSTESQLPEACEYNVQFGKPFLVPGSAELLIYQPRENHWSYLLENSEKGNVILTAEIKSLSN